MKYIKSPHLKYHLLIFQEKNIYPHLLLTKLFT